MQMMGSFRNLILNSNTLDDEANEAARRARYFATPGIPAVSSMHITLHNIRKNDVNSWRGKVARTLTSPWYHSSVAVAVMADAFAISVVRLAAKLAWALFDSYLPLWKSQSMLAEASFRMVIAMVVLQWLATLYIAMEVVLKVCTVVLQKMCSFFVGRDITASPVCRSSH
jgi:hypothetical protein